MKNSEAILVTPKQFEIQECPVPEPKDHEILMKVEYVGMCGSDIHGFEFGPFIPPKDPNQKIGLGHEVAGEVVKVGSKVTRFKAGDKVLIEPGVPDDKCEYCRTGRYNICPDVDFMATQPNYKGALTQYMTHPEEWTYHIPEGMTTMEAALVEPAAVGMHAAILGGAQLGKSIVILGGGTIGLMVLQACKSLGATDITVVDIMQNRLDLALKLGASRSYRKKLASGCCGASDESVKKNKVADKDKSHYPYEKTLVVDGMVCKNCSARVENALNSIDGVWAEADVSSGRVTVRMKREIEDKVLKKAVNDIGAYTVMKAE